MESRIDTTLLTEEPPISFDFLEELVEQGVGPGILLLSPALKLMHMNRRAWELSRKITQGENGKAATGVLPPAVTELCAEVSAALRVRIDAKDWEQVQITRLVGTPSPPVLLRAFGLPDGGEAHRARIFILMEEVAHRKERGSTRARSGPTSSSLHTTPAVDLSTFHKVQDRKDAAPVFPASENLTVHE